MKNCNIYIYKIFEKSLKNPIKPPYNAERAINLQKTVKISLILYITPVLQFVYTSVTNNVKKREIEKTKRLNDDEYISKK